MGQPEWAKEQHGLRLAGVGTRKKMMIDIYYVALYCDDIQSTANNEDIMNSGCDKTIVLSLNFSLGYNKLKNALVEALGKRNAGKGQEILLSENYMGKPGLHFNDGDQILLQISGSNLTPTVNGEVFPPIESRELCKAIMGTYFDKNNLLGKTFKMR